MKKQFEDVKRINNLDPASTQDRLCKLYEEIGELSQAVNKLIGRKVTDGANEGAIIELVREEASDTIQCLFSFLDSCGIDYDNLGMTGVIGNCKDDEIYGQTSSPQLRLINAYRHLGVLSDVLISSEQLKSVSGLMIQEILSLAGFYGIMLGEIKNTIMFKNKKWESVIDKRNG